MQQQMAFCASGLNKAQDEYILKRGLSKLISAHPETNYFFINKPSGMSRIQTQNPEAPGQIRVCSHLLSMGLCPSRLSLSYHLLIYKVALTQRAAVRVTGLCCVDPRPQVSPDGPTFLSQDRLPVPPMSPKYWMTFFMFSVLPAPDSPLQVESGSRQVTGREGSGCREAK